MTYEALVREKEDGGKVNAGLGGHPLVYIISLILLLVPTKCRCGVMSYTPHSNYMRLIIDPYRRLSLRSVGVASPFNR